MQIRLNSSSQSVSESDLLAADDNMMDQTLVAKITPMLMLMLMLMLMDHLLDHNSGGVDDEVVNT